METRFVDANVFYYHLLQDRDHGPRASGILRRIRGGEATATSVVVVSELASLFEFRILQARRSQTMSPPQKDRIAARFEECMSLLYGLIASLAHLEKLDCTWEDAAKAFTYRSQYRLGFNDASSLAIMERHGISTIYSFDKSFDRVPWLTRRME